MVKALGKEDEISEEKKEVDPYKVAKDIGIYEELEIENDMTIETIA